MKIRLSVLFVSAWITLCAHPILAQEVCGGFAGIPCDAPDEFCLLPDGDCCCDFFGVCMEVPESCAEIHDPVCGCDGVTYENRCEASRLGVSVQHACPCESPGEERASVAGSGFTSLERLSWNPIYEGVGYNVYVRNLDFYGPVFEGTCLYDTVADNSVLLHGTPSPDQVWMFQVTGLYDVGEGSMGLTSDCEPRTPLAPCTCTLPSDVGPCEAAIPRWFHNFLTGQCEEFLWGGCEGNANNFETLADCGSACLNVCDEPAEVGSCTAAIPRWYYSVLSGHCSEFVWGGCGGNQNNYPSELACRDACGDICLLPPDVGDCDGDCPRWYFNPGTGQCEIFTWGCCDGNRNNFETQSECEAECGR